MKNFIVVERWMKSVFEAEVSKLIEQDYTLVNAEYDKKTETYRAYLVMPSNMK